MKKTLDKIRGIDIIAFASLEVRRKEKRKADKQELTGVIRGQEKRERAERFGACDARLPLENRIATKN